MELSAAEFKTIQTQVNEWLTNPEHELETTFGETGQVDMTTFLNVAKRLRTKGYSSLPQGDIMTVMTKENIRFSLNGLGVIQQYCRDDTMAGKPFVAMIKDRSVKAQNVDVDEYGFRIKSRREIPLGTDDAAVKKLFASWADVPKAFRIIRRWTFEDTGIRIDMSIVKSTKKVSGGNFRWQKKYRDQNVMQAAPIYEIEVELQRMAGDTLESATKRLIRGVGEVLRGIQKNVVLIRKSTVRRVLDSYKLLVGSDVFRGPAPIPLQKENFSKERERGKPNIRDGYNVTDKADGLRCLGYCNGSGELFLIDMSMRNIYRTGIKQPECRESLLDGEWVTQTRDKEPVQQYLVFDIFFAADKKDVSQLPFYMGAVEAKLQSRHGQMEKWVATWNKPPGPTHVVKGITSAIQMQVSMKDFVFARGGDELSIFRAAARILDLGRIYYTDGLIFTPNAKPLPATAGSTFYEQFKWKPPRDNTVDFLVKFQKTGAEKTGDKITVGVKPGQNETVSYKTLRLFVGSSIVNPRSIVMNELELPKPERMMKGSEIKGEYKPVLFTPKEFPDTMASYCYLPVETDPDTGETYVKTHEGEPIQDRTIVEMSYDPKEAPGWRWTPLRVRSDKTERFHGGTIGRTLNSDKAAESVWNTIYDPITTHMIRTGDGDPSEEEQAELNALKSVVGGKDAYYDRKKAPVEDHMLTRTMRDFHNRFIKEKLLYRIGLHGTGKTLLDMACGVGADLGIWIRSNVSFVLGVDYSGPNITGEKDGIYRRYLERQIMTGREAIPPMVFAIGNSTKNYTNGDAGVNDEEKNILRSVLGRVRPSGTLPPYIETTAASRLKTRADCMSCMFAIHYFFETRETFAGFLKNVAENLKIGGYFIGCCFDGKKVFELLRNTPSGSNVVGTEGDVNVWSITKGYEAEDLPLGEESLGLAVDVNFVTIGTNQREYLVNYDTLVEGMASIGCEPLSKDSLKQFKLSESSTTFDVAWDTAKKGGNTYTMPDAVRKFSFMNRWFVFQRKHEVAAAVEENTGVRSLKERVAESMPVPEKEEELNGEEETGAATPGAPTPGAATPGAATPGAATPGAATPGSSKKAAATATVAPMSVKRTIPVAPGQATPAEATYVSGELFQFHTDAAEKDFLGINDKGAGKWLSPTAPFPIEDPEVDGVVYPTMNHFLAAMRYRLASNAPDIATTVFSREGSIHQKFIRIRVDESEGGKKLIPEKRDQRLLKEEDSEVRDEIRPSAFKRRGATFDEAKWASKKDEILKEGLRQRWEKDKRFRKIVEAARDKGKTLLYYAPGANSSNFGGVHKSTGQIEGENRIGKYIMELAGF
uniref:mRNA (guanine-N(7))-methyltransferase n=1 Tax=viral metagenome TaxID=1070528 RepID=A0A6C0K7V1_9ZZZZ